jgi:dephospho-CoA kinase
MKVVGLTGNICSGKSTVAGFLAKHGAVIISADEIGHEALKPFGETWRRVVDAFGNRILGADNEIDRKKLGEIVFGDPEALARLNGIMHPGMHEVARRRIEEHKRAGSEVVVLEAPLLIEANWLDLVDEVWVADASEETMVKRCLNRSALSETEARSRIAAQMPAEEKASHADVVINTDVPLREVEAKVDELWRRTCSPR